jgi:hypothetical protein
MLQSTLAGQHLQSLTSSFEHFSVFTSPAQSVAEHIGGSCAHSFFMHGQSLTASAEHLSVFSSPEHVLAEHFGACAGHLGSSSFWHGQFCLSPDLQRPESDGPPQSLQFGFGSQVLSSSLVSSVGFLSGGWVSPPPLSR